jgi:hypothetical protein
MDEENQAREEAERKRKLQLERENLRVQTEMMAKRRHPHIMLWLKVKTELILILMAQNRTEDVQDCLSVMKLECLSVKDSFFVRQIDQIEFMLLVQSGLIKPALNKGYEILNFAKKQFHNDKSLSEF